MATLNYTGLRLNELLTLRRDQLDLQRRRLRVVGKGSKVRTIPIPVPLVSILQDYLGQLRPASSSPYVFVNPRSLPTGGNRGRFGQKAVARLVERLGGEAAVPGRHHPDRWRHTYATRLLRQGIDIYLIQRLLGHADISTTAGYLHLVHDDLQAAVDKSWQ